MRAYEFLLESKDLIGKPTPSLEEISKKHGASMLVLQRELLKGIKEEGEHTNNDDEAREIALDHLWEDPLYYSKLAKIMKEDTILEFAYDGGGWLNVNTGQFVSNKGIYHNLAIFHYMEKFGLTPERMKKIPAFAKWFNLDWSKITGNDDPKELETWWFDLDINEVPTMDGKMMDWKPTDVNRTDVPLDGDMEIIRWMNNNGWVRTIRHQSSGYEETSIEGSNLKQILRAARMLNKEKPIEMLAFDINDLSNSHELRGDKLQHFLRYGNLNFPQRIF